MTTQPGLMMAAAGDLEGVGSAMSAGNAVAAGLTTGVVPAAADEVSALLTTAQFVAHAALYQAAAIHDLFVTALGISAGSYAAVEVTNAAAF